jgi:hypothetical protein
MRLLTDRYVLRWLRGAHCLAEVRRGLWTGSCKVRNAGRKDNKHGHVVYRLSGLEKSPNIRYCELYAVSSSAAEERRHLRVNESPQINSLNHRYSTIQMNAKWEYLLDPHVDTQFRHEIIIKQ